MSEIDAPSNDPDEIIDFLLEVLQRSGIIEPNHDGTKVIINRLHNHSGYYEDLGEIYLGVNKKP